MVVFGRNTTLSLRSIACNWLAGLPLGQKWAKYILTLRFAIYRVQTTRRLAASPHTKFRAILKWQILSPVWMSTARACACARSKVGQTLLSLRSIECKWLAGLPLVCKPSFRPFLNAKFFSQSWSYGVCVRWRSAQNGPKLSDGLSLRSLFGRSFGLREFN